MTDKMAGIPLPQDVLSRMWIEWMLEEGKPRSTIKRRASVLRSVRNAGKATLHSSAVIAPFAIRLMEDRALSACATPAKALSDKAAPTAARRKVDVEPAALWAAL